MLWIIRSVSSRLPPANFTRRSSWSRSKSRPAFFPVSRYSLIPELPPLGRMITKHPLEEASQAVQLQQDSLVGLFRDLSCLEVRVCPVGELVDVVRGLISQEQKTL